MERHADTDDMTDDRFSMTSFQSLKLFQRWKSAKKVKCTRDFRTGKRLILLFVFGSRCPEGGVSVPRADFDRISPSLRPGVAEDSVSKACATSSDDICRQPGFFEPDGIFANDTRRYFLRNSISLIVGPSVASRMFSRNSRAVTGSKLFSNVSPKVVPLKIVFQSSPSRYWNSNFCTRPA